MSRMTIHMNLIDGDWVGDNLIPNINPSDTGDVVSEFARATVAQAQAAVEAASRAFPLWSRSSFVERHGILSRAANEIIARKDEIARLLSREQGKTLSDAIAETTRTAQIFDYYAGEAMRLAGEILPSHRPGVEIQVTREPVGVVGVITPWSFPLAMPAWQIAPALCYGNTVVFKPAELTPGSAWTLADILHRAGLPHGVLNLIIGEGMVVGQAMIDHPDIRALTFAGSESIAERVVAASVRHGRKFELALGAKNPLVILDDADLDTAVGCAIESAFFSAGQCGTASSRLIVTENIHDRFVKAMVERLETLQVGHALDEATKVGPVVDEMQLNQSERYIAIGQEDGASLVCGGNRVSRETPGFYLRPALFTECSNAMRIARKEIFGPVAAVIRVGDYEEALAAANENTFSISAGICTTNISHANHFRRNAEATMVMINLPTAGTDFHASFGARRQSSVGPREQSRNATEFYTRIKTAYTAI